MLRLSLILSLFSLTCSAQSLHVDSTRFIGGYKGATDIFYTIPTADKGIFFVGMEIGNPGDIIPPFPLDTTGENVFVGKIDSNQHISWLHVYGGSKNDEAFSACQTPDGGFAVLAQTNSSDGDVTGFLGVVNMWLLRLDTGGNLLWEKCYGAPAGALSIANTPDHGFIMLGTSNGSGNDIPFHYGDQFSDDWVVIKTDSLGNKQWCRDIGGTGGEGGGGVFCLQMAGITFSVAPTLPIMIAQIPSGIWV